MVEPTIWAAFCPKCPAERPAIKAALLFDFLPRQEACEIIGEWVLDGYHVVKTHEPVRCGRCEHD